MEREDDKASANALVRCGVSRALVSRLRFTYNGTLTAGVLQANTPDTH